MGLTVSCFLNIPLNPHLLLLHAVMGQKTWSFFGGCLLRPELGKLWPFKVCDLYFSSINKQVKPSQLDGDLPKDGLAHVSMTVSKLYKKAVFSFLSRLISVRSF